MKHIKIININLISKLDRYPLCLQTYDLANKLYNNKISINDLPPIHTKMINGTHTIIDGRHRYTAIKLAGINKIKVKYGTREKTSTY